MAKSLYPSESNSPVIAMLYCGMTGLLTGYGIPPRIVGSFPQERRQSLVSYAAGRTREDYPDWQSVPEEVQPFASRVHAVTDSFVRWGAVINNTRGGTKLAFFHPILKKARQPFRGTSIFIVTN